VEKDFDLCINVNLKSLLYASSVLLPTMIKQGRGGSFIQTASVSAKRPAAPGLTWYAASKAAVVTVRSFEILGVKASIDQRQPLQATKSLAVEYGPHQIRFNSVSPGIGATGMFVLFSSVPHDRPMLTFFLSPGHISLWARRTHRKTERSGSRIILWDDGVSQPTLLILSAIWPAMKQAFSPE
jgi:NAD(P)-dependent dehydrogenase (short-subunit alcohol dehydrogenase family)